MARSAPPTPHGVCTAAFTVSWKYPITPRLNPIAASVVAAAASAAAASTFQCRCSTAHSSTASSTRYTRFGFRPHSSRHTPASAYRSRFTASRNPVSPHKITGVICPMCSALAAGRYVASTTRAIQRWLGSPPK